MTRLDPSLIEVEDVKPAAVTELKAMGVVEFSFIIRVADPAAAIGELKKAVEGGGSGSVPVEATGKDGSGKELDRDLDVSGIQEVALVAVRCGIHDPCCFALPPTVCCAHTLCRLMLLILLVVSCVQVARAAERLGEDLLPHVPMLVGLVKTLLGAKPVVITAQAAAKNSRAGHQDLDLQVEVKRDEQQARRRFQQKCLQVVRVLSDLPEVSECEALAAFTTELGAADSPFAEVSPLASLWASFASSFFVWFRSRSLMFRHRCGTREARLRKANPNLICRP